MSEVRYYAETPCEHGLPYLCFSLLDDQTMCPGGSRVELTPTQPDYAEATNIHFYGNSGSWRNHIRSILDAGLGDGLLLKPKQ